LNAEGAATYSALYDGNAVDRTLAEFTRKKAGKVTDIQSAMRLLGEAVRLRPDVAKYRYDFGRALFRARLFDQARMEFAEAIRLQPNYPGAARALTLTTVAIEGRAAEDIVAAR
jgi:Flp pilus assembly protein TadD